MCVASLLFDSVVTYLAAVEGEEGGANLQCTLLGLGLVFYVACGGVVFVRLQYQPVHAVFA